MKNKTLLILAASALATALPAQQKPAGNTRAWHDNKGRELIATFRGIKDENIFLQMQDGSVHRVPLANLSEADQTAAKSLKVEGLGIPMDPDVAQAAAAIDKLVLGGLQKHDQHPNALTSDEQFIRRVYLDLAGRIPTRDETIGFLTDKSNTKRARVIDALVSGEGFTSRMFNYFADMLRIADDANKIKYFTYEEWLKQQVAENRPWNVIVREMLSADGNMLQNGATGYLLRDKGMKLDNLSLTLTTFLGANVACAQCHDHPFAEWTQKQFFQMAAFMGETETEMPGGRRMLAGLDRQTAKQAKNIMRVNTAMVIDQPTNDMKLPKDYKYKDGKPNEPVKPTLVTWSKEDAKTKLYHDVSTELKASKSHEIADRDVFAKWLTSPDNPRFAMTIANRLWKVVFGVAVREPVTDLDNPDAASNPELLRHLAAEMKRLNFDIRAYMRLLCNTETYQREAVTQEIAMGDPFFFPGPILRRMTSEQAWDSCVTLAIGDKVDAFKLKRGDAYAKVMDLHLQTSSPSEVQERVVTVLNERSSLRGLIGKGANAKPGKRPARMAMMQDTEDNGENDYSKPAVMSGLVLARAAELPQPERGEHFLRMFGQSDRQISDSSTDEGSIPQVMMLMNGDAQEVLHNPKSKVLSTALAEKAPESQIQDIYVSFLSRNPKPKEMADAKAALAGGLSTADLTWVLFNSREFIFVQ